jgi:hypothetical protein
MAVPFNIDLPGSNKFTSVEVAEGIIVGHSRAAGNYDD